MAKSVQQRVEEGRRQTIASTAKAMGIKIPAGIAPTPSPRGEGEVGVAAPTVAPSRPREMPLGAGIEERKRAVARGYVVERRITPTGAEQFVAVRPTKPVAEPTKYQVARPEKAVTARVDVEKRPKLVRIAKPIERESPLLQERAKAFGVPEKPAPITLERIEKGYKVAEEKAKRLTYKLPPTEKVIPSGREKRYDVITGKYYYVSPREEAIALLKKGQEKIPKFMRLSKKELEAGRYVLETEAGAYEEIRERPVKTVAIAGLGLATMGAGRVAALGGAKLTPYAPRAVIAGKEAAKWGGRTLGAIYATQKTAEFVEAEKAEKYAGGRVIGQAAVEVGAFVGGMKAGAKLTKPIATETLLAEVEAPPKGRAVIAKKKISLAEKAKRLTKYEKGIGTEYKWKAEKGKLVETRTGITYTPKELIAEHEAARLYLGTGRAVYRAPPSPVKEDVPLEKVFEKPKEAKAIKELLVEKKGKIVTYGSSVAEAQGVDLGRRIGDIDIAYKGDPKVLAKAAKLRLPSKEYTVAGAKVLEVGHHKIDIHKMEEITKHPAALKPVKTPSGIKAMDVRELGVRKAIGTVDPARAHKAGKDLADLTKISGKFEEWYPTTTRGKLKIQPSRPMLGGPTKAPTFESYYKAKGYLPVTAYATYYTGVPSYLKPVAPTKKTYLPSAPKKYQVTTTRPYGPSKAPRYEVAKVPSKIPIYDKPSKARPYIPSKPYTPPTGYAYTPTPPTKYIPPPKYTGAGYGYTPPYIPSPPPYTSPPPYAYATTYRKRIIPYGGRRRRDKEKKRRVPWDAYSFWIHPIPTAKQVHKKILQGVK